MKYLLLVFTAILASFSGLSQRSIDVQYSIEWTDDQGETPVPVGKVGFETALWEDELPTALFTKEIQGNASRVQLILENLESEIINENELTARQIQLLPTQVVLEPTVKQGRTDYYVQIRIIPIWRDPQTGVIRRLLSFDGLLEFTPGRSVTGRALSWAPNSVLAEGTFYKLAIAEDGIYRIDRAFLQSMGIDINALDPNQINIYGNGGALLPFDNDVDRPTGLRKNAIYVEGADDGSFDSNDFILFYGRGADSWAYDEGDEIYRHTRHHYSDSAYYFMRIDDVDPLRIASAEDPGAANQTSNAFTDHQFLENENVNLAKSGREFYGDNFTNGQPVPFAFAAPNLLSEQGYFESRVAIRSMDVSSTFDMTIFGEQVGLTPSATSDGATSNFANIALANTNFIPSGDQVSVTVQLDQATPDAEGWIDYLMWNARRELSMAGSQMEFRDPTVTGAGNVTEFTMENAFTVSQIWDITDFVVPQLVPFTPDQNDPSTISFTAATEENKEFIAFGNFNFLEPVSHGQIENQNLHALTDIDLVVLTNERFLPVAEEYIAIHEEDGLTIALVDLYQVYNEFSSGNPDVTGVKMLMKMLFDRANGDVSLMPKYLQIVGDGSFQNRHVKNDAATIITYQSLTSNSPVFSYVSDDYFGFLSDDAGEALGDLMDIGVGRIPCQNVAEGLGYLNKVRSYRSGNTSTDGDAYCIGDDALSPFGAWRNVITFVADDYDGNGAPIEINHMSNSEEHNDTIISRHNDYDIVKIYMDAYQQNSTPGGERYPDAEDAIRRRVQNGSLIVNYIGHGGERGWAHERVLNTTTIQEWTNFNSLPVFVTATCELARFDDPEFKSAGELLIMNPNGGAVAMLTTTRIVFSGSNQQLNRAFFKVALEDEDIEELTLGFICMETKNDDGVTDSSNKRNFSLLGDVALKMVYPKVDVYTTEINGVAIDPLQPDTVRSLQEVTIKGYVGATDGTKLTDFNGFVYPTVYDKKSEVTTLNNDGGSSGFDYEVWKNILYKGKASVTNGDFEFSFIIPRDIAYDFGTGRVSFYAVAGDIDGHGHSEDFIIGGALEGAELNDQGPEVNLFLNDSTFVFGGITDEDPILFAKVFDENGVNTVGSGIGHDIKAILDANTSDPIILNDFYESDLDTYQSGEIRYQLNSLSEGTHNLSLKVWDVHNNSSEAYTEFVVADSEELVLEHVLNYPNPFTTHTEFMFEHNQPCDFLDVQIQVFTVGGKMVKSINRTVRSEGFRGEPISWDGLDDFGDTIGRGVYVYRVKVTTPEGQSTEQFEKLVILR
ncbi:type IX secretion system sortase PorU [Sanyastnella coralliicola]|uniref:type IX secretion system sortase PorU n=1 Tax=Sanyastnella coralliicola TaxID=3069118 RepID=UPI0027B996EB|nr:type IX secretion system sortase PorU [Longitalea sp. SCSIO 12813]